MKTYVQAKTCSWMFTTALFITDKKSKAKLNVRELVIDTQNVQPVHTREYYSARKRCTKTYDNMDGPWTHHAKWQKPHTDAHVLYDSISGNVQNRQIHRDRNQTSGCQGREGQDNGQWLLMRVDCFRMDKNLESAGGDGRTTCEYTKNHRIVWSENLYQLLKKSIKCY